MGKLTWTALKRKAVAKKDEVIVKRSLGTLTLVRVLASFNVSSNNKESQQRAFESRLRLRWLLRTRPELSKRFLGGDFHAQTCLSS